MLLDFRATTSTVATKLPEPVNPKVAIRLERVLNLERDSHHIVNLNIRPRNSLSLLILITFRTDYTKIKLRFIETFDSYPMSPPKRTVCQPLITLKKRNN